MEEKPAQSVTDETTIRELEKDTTRVSEREREREEREREREKD